MLTVSTIASISTSSFSLAMQAQGKTDGGASALIGFFSMISGAIMAPLVGIAGDQTAMQMACIMVVGEILALLCFYRRILPYHTQNHSHKFFKKLPIRQTGWVKRKKRLH